MKKTKYIIAVGLMFMAVSCTKDLSELNVDPKNPSTAPSYAFFTNAQRTFSNTLASANVNLNIFRLIVQHWQETQYPEESQYDLGTREINDNMWNAFYRDVIKDIRESKSLIPTDVSDADVQKNQLAVAEIMEIYTWYYLVTMFGDIPYAEAMDIDKPFPVYDDAKTIFNDLLTRLDAAIGNINTAIGSFGGADIVYNGNTSRWMKFGNSLKLKMALTIADEDDARARDAVESAIAGGVFTSNLDNALFRYQGAPPNTNPIWVDLVNSNRDDFVAASTLIDELKDLDDPRIDNFFTPDQSGNDYSGAPPGVQSAYAQFSHVHPSITVATFPNTLMDYSEVEFYLAEAAARGYGVTGSASEHYEKAITASIVFWGGTPAEATGYLAGVPYNSANWRESIGMQQWFAFYNRGMDAWISWRKFDYPHLDPAHDALSDIPVRYPYPVNEQNVNRVNYEAASAAIGGDFVETKLWWDIH